ncbi:MAG: redoxin family protein [Planctomycetia bacterium]|nr:redoxin family protein [Planctomycetia bacterium]
MRRLGAGFLVAVLALAGCKWMDPKPNDKSPGGIASRPKEKDAPAKTPSWLDDVAKMPGATTGVPKAGTWTNPADPNFNAKTEAQDALGGRVLDPNGKPARNVFLRIEALGAGGGAPIGITTDHSGYFFTRGLKPGKSYELTAEAQQDGKQLTGVVQTKVPNPILTIVLRDDLPPVGGGLPAPKGPDTSFPPAPKPSDKVADNIPPMGLAPIPKPKPTDGAWTPEPGGSGGKTGVPPATIGGPPGGGVGSPKVPAPAGGIPPPDDLSIPPTGLFPKPDMKPPKPENVADGPKEPFKPPPTSIPGPGSGGPPVPPLPKLPPSFDPPGGGRSANVGAGKFTLIDALGRPWESDSVRPGTLVLIEFMTTTCAPCKQALPFLKELQARYGASGLQLAGVVCDELPQKDRLTAAAKYSRNNNLNYALYVEPGAVGSVRNAFDVEGYPHVVLLNSAGKVLWTGHPGKRAELESAIKQHIGK